MNKLTTIICALCFVLMGCGGGDVYTQSPGSGDEAKAPEEVMPGPDPSKEDETTDLEPVDSDKPNEDEEPPLNPEVIIIFTSEVVTDPKPGIYIQFKGGASFRDFNNLVTVHKCGADGPMVDLNFKAISLEDDSGERIISYVPSLPLERYSDYVIVVRGATFEGKPMPLVFHYLTTGDTGDFYDFSEGRPFLDCGE